MIALAALAAVLCLLLFVPLPRSCDPRSDELTPDRYEELARFHGARTRAEIEAALRVVDPHGALAPYLILTDDRLAVRLAPEDHTAVVWVGPAPATGGTAPAAERRWPCLRAATGAWPWIRATSAAPGRRRRSARPAARVARSLREGDLTWATAGLLARRLRDAGGEVRLLRGPPPPTRPFQRDADPGFDPDARGRLLAGHQPRPRTRSPLAGALVGDRSLARAKPAGRSEPLRAVRAARPAPPGRRGRGVRRGRDAVAALQLHAGGPQRRAGVPARQLPALRADHPLAAVLGAPPRAGRNAGREPAPGQRDGRRRCSGTSVCRRWRHRRTSDAIRCPGCRSIRPTGSTLATWGCCAGRQASRCCSRGRA